jgi:tRNA-splicing ligase RtcB (3'-phosphate/5'-hydroxy nucleic acid ligase)
MRPEQTDLGIFSFRDDQMNVPAHLFTSRELLDSLEQNETSQWSSLRQLAHVASLPGVVGHVCGLADLHPGYGFPVGGVAAFDEDGLVMVGGVGFDINCGVRVLRTDLLVDDVKERQEALAEALFDAVPAGLGVAGSLRVEVSEMDDLIRSGARFIVERGFGAEDDLEFIEDHGSLEADPAAISLRAKQRNIKQVGTLGSGNHYLEAQYVEEIFDEAAAAAFGLQIGSVVISLHCGSRGLGHQVGQEYLDEMSDAMAGFGIPLLESELVGAPIRSELGQRYLSAIRGASNAAFANRQMIAHLTRKAVTSVFADSSVETLYEVGHNTAKLERHLVDGSVRDLLVHRKGSTRAFGPGHASLPERYRSIGQPIPVGGTMGTASYLLRGTQRAMELTFGSAIHGAGRSKSRVESKRTYDADRIIAQLEAQGIIVKGHSPKGISEEAPGSYKDIEQVIAATTLSGIAERVVRLKPLISIKG